MRLTLPFPTRPLLELTLMDPDGPGSEPTYRQRIGRAANEPTHTPMGGDAERLDGLLDGQERTISGEQLARLVALINTARAEEERYIVACHALQAFLAGREEVT